MLASRFDDGGPIHGGAEEWKLVDGDRGKKFFQERVVVQNRRIVRIGPWRDVGEDKATNFYAFVFETVNCEEGVVDGSEFVCCDDDGFAVEGF